MNRGPQKGKGRNGDDRSFVQKAEAGWNANAPDWVLVLAEYSDAHSQAAAARAIGYSGPVVSFVLSGTYNGDYTRIEGKVRGALMGLTVDCPVLGQLSRHRCLDEQRRRKPPLDPQSIRLFNACRAGCPNYLNRKGD